MLVTWTVLRTASPVPTAPWVPAGSTWWQSGHSSAGRPQTPESDGRCWSVVATWDHLGAAQTGPPDRDDVVSWHTVLEVTSSHGDVVMAGGARPFDALAPPPAPALAPTPAPAPAPAPSGAVAMLTVAGSSADDGREREFFRRFLHVSRDVARAPGHLLSLVQAPASAGQAGPVLVLSAWQDLAAGLDWAYTSSRAHTSAVVRQREHRLVEHSGSVRCAVVSTRGVLGDVGDPLADVVAAVRG